ncbi:MAG: FeoB-associated Cys-rich membrane protein [Oscillospiraceae bacterium]|nr:FeoB-associated Cys-rich membrane protein [Oscillospiraceae bacterium]
MLFWLHENIGTIVVALALAAVVALVVFRLHRDRKSGKSSCGCNCGSCPMSGSCHPKA